MFVSTYQTMILFALIIQMGIWWVIQGFYRQIASMEAVDTAIATLEQAVKGVNGILVILADHGNADDMTKTAHTLNPVPFVIADSNPQYCLADVSDAGLANVAATLCELLDIMLRQNMIHH